MRSVIRLLTLVVLAYFVFELGWFAAHGQPWGDWHIYREAAQRWLATGSYFLPSQLAGAHMLAYGDILYPPSALWLFVPMSFLPDALWIAIPLAVIGAALRTLRPRPLACLLMALLLAWPVVPAKLSAANPLLWMDAALFAWAAWGFPAALVLLKPTLLPFALVGMRSRSWWLGAGLVAVVSLIALPLTLDWVNVTLWTRGTSWWYSMTEWPAMVIPLVAWADRRNRLADTETPRADDLADDQAGQVVSFALAPVPALRRAA